MKKIFKEIIVTDKTQEIYLTLFWNHQLSSCSSIFIDLNNYSEKEIKQLEEDLERQIQAKYDELLSTYESSDEYAGKKRDECHQKSLEIAFPEKNTLLHVNVTLQGYIDNEGVKTIFDGGLNTSGLYTISRINPVYINLDEYGEQDMEKIQEELEKLIQGRYDELLSIYESSDEYEGHTKNGTYRRSVKIAFPEEGKTIKITITIQRHKGTNGKTRSFFGGLIVPGCSLLVCQAILLLAARSAYEEDHAENTKQKKSAGFTEYQSKKDFYASWGIASRTYRKLLRKAHEWHAATGQSQTLQSLLRTFLYNIPIESTGYQIAGLQGLFC